MTADAVKLERELTQALEERDTAEQALSQAFYLVTGRSPEWSNLFGYSHALEEIDDTCHLLRVRLDPLRQQERERCAQALWRESQEFEVMATKQARARRYDDQKIWETKARHYRFAASAIRALKDEAGE